MDGIGSVGKAGEQFFLGFSVIALGTLGFVLLLTQMRRTNAADQAGSTRSLRSALRNPALVGDRPDAERCAARSSRSSLRPGFDGLRHPRFTVIAFVALGALVALAYQHLADRSPAGGAWRRLAVLVILEVGEPAGRVIVPEGERLATNSSTNFERGARTADSSPR